MAMSAATVSLLSSLNMDDVVAFRAAPGGVVAHALVPVTGCGGTFLKRSLVKTHLPLSGYDAEPERVVRELTMLLGQDVLAAMQRVGTVPRLAAGLPIRRILVVYNPHSGNNKAGKLFDTVIRPVLDVAGVGWDKSPTQFPGHAIQMGQAYDADAYEGIMFISGDGTVKEFLEGVTRRANWYSTLCRTPLCSVSSGTANALALGLRTACPLTAAYCIVKHIVRPVDAILVVPPSRDRVLLSVCGTGWGVPGDIAAESESCRGFRTSRYCLLKVKRGALCPKKHTGSTYWSSVQSPFVQSFLRRSLLWSAGIGLPSGAHTLPPSPPHTHAQPHTRAPNGGSQSSADSAAGLITPGRGGDAPTPVPQRMDEETKGEDDTAVDGAVAGPPPPSVDAGIACMEALLALSSSTVGRSKEEVCARGCTRCVPVTSFAEARRLQYQAEAAAPSPSLLLSPAPLFADMEELPTEPASAEPYWAHLQGQFVAVGGVNTAQDSKYSHASDGFIDFVAARKGGCCDMVKLGGLYVCGKEFQSPLMVHEKVQGVVVLPAEGGNAHFNLDGEDLCVSKGGGVAMFLLPSLIPMYGLP